MIEKEVVSVLNDLVKNARDSERNFRIWAEQIEAANIQRLFSERARGYAHASQELEALVIQYGGEPASGGTAEGALRRSWVTVKGAIGLHSKLSILELCERGEDCGIARYREALEKNLPADVRSLVEQQAARAQKLHEQIRDLRNAARPRM